MVKSLSALAVLYLMGASVITVPGLAPEVQAGELAVLPKADRLDVRVALPNCATQVWPFLAQSCLHVPESGKKIMQARLVTAGR